MKRSKVSQWAGLLLLGVGLTACAGGPKPPLLSPITVAKEYGYAELQTGENTFDVTYTMPVRHSTRYAGQREADAAASRVQAYDFALWRAAQLAQERGYPGFQVRNSRSNVDTTIEDPYYDPFFADPFFGPPYWNRRFRPYPFGYPSYRYGPYSPQAYLRAQVTVTVQLLQAPGPGDYDAQDVIRQLQQTYPNAEREIVALFRGAVRG